MQFHRVHFWVYRSVDFGQLEHGSVPCAAHTPRFSLVQFHESGDGGEGKEVVERGILVTIKSSSLFYISIVDD